MQLLSVLSIGIKRRLSSNNENDWVIVGVIVEIMHQTLGMKPYWTQVMAAMISLSQRIAEMDTGKGKCFP